MNDNSQYEEILMGKIKDSVEEIINKRVEPIQKAVISQGSTLKKMGDQSANLNISGDNELQNILEGNKDSFQNLKNGNASSVKVVIPSKTIKALTERANVVGSTQAMRLNGFGQLGNPATSLRSLFRAVPVGPNSGGRVKYMDQSEVTRAAAMRAEGVAKPESSIEWIERTMEIRKVADSLVATKEILDDYSYMASELELFLATNLALRVETQLWSGSGVDPNMKGLYTSAPEFAGYAGPVIEDGNLFDLLSILRADMISRIGSKSTPNFVALNAKDFAAFKRVKNSLGSYVSPGEVDATTLSGMRIVESSQVAQNTLVIGDSRFGTIFEHGGVELSYFPVGSQFIENKITILAEERLGMLIRGVDEEAFLKISSISEALANLSSPNS